MIMKSFDKCLTLIGISHGHLSDISRLYMLLFYAQSDY